jgi:hypothetical protein
MEHIDILNDLRPWDCEQFPKSKNICFGGGGGNPIQKVLDPVAKGVSKVGGEVTGGLTQGMDALGKVTEMTPNIPTLPTPNIPTPNLDFVHEGISHNIGEFGKGMNAIGDVVMHNVKQLQNIGNIGKGGGGGASAGAGVMGPASGGLARLGASKLQMKKAGMGRRQTYLTKG